MPRKYKVNQVVWALIEGFPFWPGRVVQAEAHHLKALHCDKLPPNHYVVSFFNDNNQYQACEAKNILPFHDANRLHQVEKQKDNTDLYNAFIEAKAFLKQYPKPDNTLEKNALAMDNDASSPAEQQQPKRRKSGDGRAKKRKNASVSLTANGDSTARVDKPKKKKRPDPSPPNGKGDEKQKVTKRKYTKRLPSNVAKDEEVLDGSGSRPEDKRVEKQGGSKRKLSSVQNQTSVPTSKEKADLLGECEAEILLGGGHEDPSPPLIPAVVKDDDALDIVIPRKGSRKSETSVEMLENAKNIQAKKSCDAKLSKTKESVKGKGSVKAKESANADQSVKAEERVEKEPTKEVVLPASPLPKAASSSKNEKSASPQYTKPDSPTEKRPPGSPMQISDSKHNPSPQEDESLSMTFKDTMRVKSPGVSERGDSLMHGLDKPEANEVEFRHTDSIEEEGEMKTFGNYEDEGDDIGMDCMSGIESGVTNENDIENEKLYDLHTKEEYLKIVLNRERSIRLRHANLWYKAITLVDSSSIFRTEDELSTACGDAIRKGQAFLRWCDENENEIEKSSAEFLEWEGVTCSAAVRLQDLYFDVGTVSLVNLGNQMLGLAKAFTSLSSVVATAYRDIVMLWVDVCKAIDLDMPEMNLKGGQESVSRQGNNFSMDFPDDSSAENHDVLEKKSFAPTEVQSNKGMVSLSQRSKRCSISPMEQVMEEKSIIKPVSSDSSKGKAGKLSPMNKIVKKSPNGKMEVVEEKIEEEKTMKGAVDIKNETGRKNMDENGGDDVIGEKKEAKSRQKRVKMFSKEKCLETLTAMLDTMARNALSVKLPKSKVNNLAIVMEREIAKGTKDDDKEGYYTSSIHVIRWAQKAVKCLGAENSEEMTEPERHASSLLVSCLKDTTKVQQFMECYKKLLL